MIQGISKNFHKNNEFNYLELLGYFQKNNKYGNILNSRIIDLFYYKFFISRLNCKYLNKNRFLRRKGEVNVVIFAYVESRIDKYELLEKVRVINLFNIHNIIFLVPNNLTDVVINSTLAYIQENVLNDNIIKFIKFNYITESLATILLDAIIQILIKDNMHILLDQLEVTDIATNHDFYAVITDVVNKTININSYKFKLLSSNKITSLDTIYILPDKNKLKVRDIYYLSNHLDKNLEGVISFTENVDLYKGNLLLNINRKTDFVLSDILEVSLYSWNIQELLAVQNNCMIEINGILMKSEIIVETIKKIPLDIPLFKNELYLNCIFYLAEVVPYKIFNNIDFIGIINIYNIKHEIIAIGTLSNKQYLKKYFARNISNISKEIEKKEKQVYSFLKLKKLLISNAKKL